MIRMDFFELLGCFLDNLTFEEIDVLGLPSLDPDVLKGFGYEMVGYEKELHAYEKIIYAPYKGRSVSLLYKLYFYGGGISGSGLSIEPKIRLTTPAEGVLGLPGAAERIFKKFRFLLLGREARWCGCD